MKKLKFKITKILFLVMIMFVTVFFAGCDKSDKTTNQNNNNPISPVSDQNDEINLATDIDTPDIKDSSSNSDNSDQLGEEKGEVIEKEKKQDKNNIPDWLIYTNAKAKYKISYPKIYAVTEYKDNLEIITINFKDTNNADYYGGEIYIKTGNSANTADNILAEIKKECDEYNLCADISENKVVDLSNIKRARKITYSRAIGGYATSYFFTGKDGQVNFELNFNFEEDEVREKIINSFEFF